MSPGKKRYRAGDKLDDLCRPCKLVRGHTVIVAGPSGEPLRVLCDYCGSQHNYRGGAARTASPTPQRSTRGTEKGPFELVSERERSDPPMSHDESATGGQDLELLIHIQLQSPH